MLLRELFEAAGSVGLIFGRFNPPHKGHKAAWEMASKNSAWYVGTNQSTQGPKDPLPYDVKIKAMKTIWPKVAGHIVPHQSWLTLASDIYKKHGDVELKVYTDEEWVLKALNQYNGVEGKSHGFYNFPKITPVPTPRLSSATALRAAVAAGDRKAFADAAGVPADTPVDGKPFFDLVAEYLGQYKKENANNNGGKLTELFDKPYPYTLNIGQTDAEANIILPDKSKLHVGFLKGKNKWDMAFSRNGSFDADDQGDQYKVLSTVVAVFMDFVNKVKPAKITFDADKDSTGSRVDVYTKMLNRYASKMGYDFSVKNPMGDSILQYTLTKKKPTAEDATPDEEDDFHTQLDKLVHKYFGHSSDEKKLKKKVKESYKLQLERDPNMYVLHIVDTKTGKRTEVRGKMGYETDGYDPNDKLHQLLDRVGKSASVSDLINGDVVTINPRHPDGASAKAATDQAYNEAFDTDAEWVSDLNSRNVQVFATKIDDAYIELTYKRIFPADVYISFTRGGRMSVTGEGGQNKIFGAVINHVKQWVAKNKPPRIIFSAFKPNTGPFGSQDTTRSSLYRKMVQRFAGQNGYEFDVENSGSEDTFVLTRKNAEESISEESGKEMLKIFRRMHHDKGMNKDMDSFIQSHDWKLGNFTPDMFPSEEEFFDYDDPFDRIIDIDYNSRVDLSQPIIVGPQYRDGKYSVIDGNHRAAAAQRLGKTIKGYFPVEKTNENFADSKVKYTNPQFDAEWEEAERYPEFVKIGKAAWIELASKGKAVTIKSARGINNTDAADPDSFKSLDRDKQARALAQLKSGNVEMPIVAVYPDGWKELIGGNTRLTAMLAQDGKATVWVFRVPDEVAELAENFADGKNPGRKGLAKRSGVNTKASVSSLRKAAKNSSGEKQRMAHWLANMKAGRQKAKKN